MNLGYLPYKLKQEQLDALYFCYNKSEAIMSLGTGVGKTITSCCLVKQLLEDIPNSIAVFIIPSKAIKAFKKELSLCNLPYHLWESDKQQNIAGARVLLITHTSLHKYAQQLQQLLPRYNCIGVVDEIHNFTVNYDVTPYEINQRTKALISVRPFFKRFYALTATTIKNNAMSLYTMSNIVKPHYFGSPQQFKSQYCITKTQFYKIKTRWKTTKDVTKTIITGFKKNTDLEKKKADLIIFRQLSYDIEYKDIDIQVEDHLWNNYIMIGRNEVPKEILEKEKINLNDYSTRLIELQKLMDNCSQIYPFSNISNKEQALLNLIKDIISQGHIPLIYCFYLDTIDRLKKIVEESNIGVEEVFVISGKVPQRQRALIEDQIKPKTVTIINRAGTESINLQKADTIIYYNLPWSIDEYIQSLGRITRNDTKFDKQYVYFLQYEGTVDNYRALIIKNRINLIEQVQGKQLDSSNNIKLDAEDTKKLRQLLLWSCNFDKPLTKEEILNQIK